MVVWLYLIFNYKIDFYKALRLENTIKRKKNKSNSVISYAANFRINVITIITKKQIIFSQITPHKK
jgi:hypothetical protein